MVYKFEDFWKEFCADAPYQCDAEFGELLRKISECVWDAAILSFVSHADELIVNKDLVAPAILKTFLEHPIGSKLELR